MTELGNDELAPHRKDFQLWEMEFPVDDDPTVPFDFHSTRIEFSFSKPLMWLLLIAGSWAVVLGLVAAIWWVFQR